MVFHPLILTARLDPESQTCFDRLREHHFPPERNFLRAHLTLFNALPQPNVDAIRSHLSDMVRHEHPCHGHTSRLLSLGRGVAFAVECPRLVTLHTKLAQLWQNELTAQDRQRRRLHITIQNKASSEAARALLNHLAQNFQPRELVFVGLDLWQYKGGPWSLIEAFSFSAG